MAQEAPGLFPRCRVRVPEDVLEVILSHCSPKDVCRLACVSKPWNEAANSNATWNYFAPWLLPGFGVESPSHSDIDRTSRPQSPLRSDLRSHFPDLTRNSGNCATFSKGVAGVPSVDGKWLLRADPNTGALQLHASVIDALNICWYDPVNPTGYWESRGSIPGSAFSACAYLQQVCWFLLGGNLLPPFPVPCGQYKVGWKLAKSPHFRWYDHAALCSVSLNGVRVMEEEEVDLREDGEDYDCTPFQRETPVQRTWRDLFLRRGSRVPNVRASEVLLTGEDKVDGEENLRWKLFEVGSVSLDGDSPGKLVELNMDVELRETTSGWWKCGLYVDALVLTQVKT